MTTYELVHLMIIIGLSFLSGYFAAAAVAVRSQRKSDTGHDTEAPR